jgi:hypothetical protein
VFQGFHRLLSQKRAQHARLVNENRLLATMFLVSFFTITTLTPEVVYESVIGVTYIENEHLDVSDTGRVTDTFQVWLMTLFFVNYSINPLIYMWRLKNYRETFKILLKLVFRLKCLCNEIFTSHFIVFLKSTAGVMKNYVYSFVISHSQVIALSIF